jgi:hypothetical protein
MAQAATMRIEQAAATTSPVWSPSNNPTTTVPSQCPSS